MAKVFEKVGVYSKKNGMVHKSIRVFESEKVQDCIDYVFEKYGVKIEKGETINAPGLLGKKYITIK